jgi:hypothetical protein
VDASVPWSVQASWLSATWSGCPRSLADAGYHRHHCRVGDVGRDHVQLHDVELLRGIDLSPVKVDPNDDRYQPSR